MNIIKKYFYFICLYVCVVSISGAISFGYMYTLHLEYTASQMSKNISEYSEVDIDRLCKIAECEEIVIHDTVIDSNGLFITEFSGEFENVLDNVYIAEGVLYLNIPEVNDVYFALSGKFFYDRVTGISIFMFLNILFFVYPIYRIAKKENENTLLGIAGNEALLLNKSMIMITENIHHELNTPLDVIDNKVEKINRLINRYLIESKQNNRKIDKDLLQSEEDFRFIKNSSEQIYSILERMRGFKNLRYSNGNKTIYDIAIEAFKMLTVSDSSYDSHVDVNLKKYKIGNTKLKNADLLSVFINHIKNSAEASSRNISIVLSGVDNGFASILIIDDGTGLAISENDVFLPNVSTKHGSDIIVRGNGMYLNKFLMKSVKGDIKIEQSETGTTFKLCVPVSEKV